ncbi:AMP-binding enzyme family protein [Mycobacterium xenopi 4042]|uniref:AMP-binding enzyme family protein n=1 Tax=Mycobacterium xenopi 4042 TaxID=1299334 RepID=X7ZVY5_MYCXE|nr:AMP-binding enzyme family protein [Mycobacterium xenopi 4042]
MNGTLLGLRAGARLVIGALFHHVAGLGNIAVALANNCAIVMFPSFSVPAWQSLKPFEPTHVITVPSVIEMLMAANALMLPSIRLIAYGGAPIHPDTTRRVHNSMPHVDLVQLFGQTEGSPLTVLSPEDHRAAARGNGELLRSVGRAAPGWNCASSIPALTGLARCGRAAITLCLPMPMAGSTPGILADWPTAICISLGAAATKLFAGGERVPGRSRAGTRKPSAGRRSRGGRCSRPATGRDDPRLHRRG